MHRTVRLNYPFAAALACLAAWPVLAAQAADSYSLGSGAGSQPAAAEALPTDQAAVKPVADDKGAKDDEKEKNRLVYRDVSQPAAAEAVPTAQAAPKPVANEKITKDDKKKNPVFRDAGYLAPGAGSVQPPATQPPMTMPPSDQPTTTAGPQDNAPGISTVALSLFGTDLVNGPATSAPAASDPGQLLASSSGVEGVSVQHRSDAAYDPIIRGFKQGEIYASADGAYWFAAQPNLDTMLSKLEPALIQDIAVIPGPYGVEYGPGLSFIDVQTVPTPRSDCPGEFQSDARTLVMVKSNGGQVAAREIFEGGDSDWGARVSYGSATGGDYRAGDGQHVDSKYNDQDVLAEFGHDMTDLSPNGRLELAYHRTDQYNTDYPGQVYNVGHMGTDAFNVHLFDDAAGCDVTKWSVTGWYNKTEVLGNADNKVDVGEHAIGGLLGLSGDLKANNLSSGVRAGLQIGETDDVHFNVGSDFRYLEDQIHSSLSFDAPPFSQTIVDELPRSYMWDPGVYADATFPWTCYWKTGIGARFDEVTTRRTDFDINAPQGTFPDHNGLYAFDITNEVKLDENWTTTFGFGQSQSPPALFDRYSNFIFAGVAQDSLTQVVGNPDLAPERNWQIDASVAADYDDFRGKASAYQSWVVDYITYAADSSLDYTPPPAQAYRVVQTVNTPLATLSGFELTGEYDLTPCFSPFAKASYVYGVDQTIHAALPSIPPLDAEVGVRWHDPCKQRKWQVELFAQMDDRQDRIGFIRNLNPIAPPFPQGPVLPFEQPTPGFVLWNLHANYEYSDHLKFTAGIDNLLNRNYFTYSDVRLTGTFLGPTPPDLKILEPGISPYFGLEWTF